ncbi:MAG: ABC transporter ATP-binding protein/permease [Clostridiales bacterium]|nr:ABC transporter ATP-binding protein/permease [Clostridiales bacterium]
MTHLEGYKKEALRSPVFIILEVICELLLPLAMAEIVNEAIPSGDIGRIFLLGGVMLLLSVLAMVFGVLSAKYATFASQGFGANLRQCLFDKIQSFSFADIDRFSSASLITRTTNDVNAMTMMLNMGLRMLWRAPVMLIVALVITIKLNARLSLVLLTVIPVLALGIGVIMKICSRLFQVMQQKIDGLNNTLQENLVAIRVVKAFVRQDHEKSKFKTANDQLTQAGMNVGLRVITMMPLMTVAMNAATVGVLYLGGKMVMKAQFDLGDLQAILTYVSQILMSVMMVAMTLLQLSRAQACARRINEVLDTEPSVENSDRSVARTLPAPRGEVEFRDVSFKYVASGTGDDVLEHISFTVRPGQFVAIVGGTGTGKSSLVNLIPRFYDVTGGAVLVDGMDVRDYPLEHLRSRIGMVLQSNILFSGTIRENLLWGDPDATEEQMIQAAKDAQAYDFIMSFPDGFDTVLEQGGVNVSGGQKQRLCIARAMLRRPAILILDDSTSAVDSATEAAIRASFAKNLKGTTVIIIAQRISSVQYADEILVLDDGKVAGQGTHEELLANNTIYQEIYQSQQEGVQE